MDQNLSLRPLPATLSTWLDLDRWMWSPGFQGTGRVVAIILLVAVVLFALGCLLWRRGSGPATHAERQASGSNFRWIHTVLAVLFPPLLAIGAWLIVLPGPKPVELVLISRVVRPELFDSAKWNNVELSAAAPTLTAMQLDIGSMVDEMLRSLEALPELPTREEIVNNGPLADQVRKILVDVVEEQADLHKLRLKANERPGDLRPVTSVHAIPAWLVESVELACCRLLVERTNVHRILIGTAGRVDRFGQSTYDDATGYLAGSGSLKSDAINPIAVSKSERAIALVSASPWPSGRALLLFQVPSRGSTSDESVEVFAKSETGEWKSLVKISFAAVERVQLISAVINPPAGTITFEARTSEGVRTEATLPPTPTPVAVLVGADMVPSSSNDAEDKSYFERAMDDLEAQGQVTFVTTMYTARSLRLTRDSANEGIWLHYEGAKFDSAIRNRGTRVELRELALREIAAPSMLSLDRHQIADCVEPAMPKAGGFVLGWAPAYRKPQSFAGIQPTASLQLGQVMQEPALIPLAAALPDQNNPRESVIWFGISPPEPTDRSIYAAAYWWTVGRLAQRCALPANLSAADLKATPPSAELRPVNLLDDQHIARISSMAHADGSVVLGIALLLASSATLVNVSLAQRRRIS